MFENSSLNNFKYLYKNSETQNTTQIILGIAEKVIPIVLIYLAVGQLHNLFLDQTVTANQGSTAGTDVASGVIAATATGIANNPVSALSGLFFNPFSLHFPLEFLVNAAVYFSPAIIIGFIFYPKLAETLRKEGGIGILLIFVASYSSSFLNSQSRIMTAFAPFLLVFITLMIDRLNWDKKYYYLLIVLTLIASKAWLIFGSEWQTPTGMGKSWTMLMMNQGMWAAKKWYVMHSFIFILISVFFLLNRKTLLGIENSTQNLANETVKDLPKKKK